MVLEAFREALREIRDLEEKMTREYLGVARRSRNTHVKAALYSLLAEKVIHTEVLRGLLRAYDRLDDLEYEARRLVQGLEEKESYEILLRLEELQGIQTRLLQLIEQFIDDVDRPVTRKLMETLLENEKFTSEQLESVIKEVRTRLEK